MDVDLNVRLDYEEHRQLIQAKVESNELPVHVQGILTLKKDVEFVISCESRRAQAFRLCRHIARATSNLKLALCVGNPFNTNFLFKLTWKGNI